MQPVRHIIDVANFYHRSAPFAISPVAFLVSGETQRIIPLQGGLTPLQPQRGARERAVDLQRSGHLGRFPDRLHASLEQHSLAQTATDLKVRFLNLWVALETLVGRPKEGSIVDAVVRAVSPLVVHRRVNDALKYLAICLHQFGFCQSIPDSTGWFVRSDKTEVKRDELLLALTTPTADAVRKALAFTVRDHPLLCNRLFTVWQSLETPGRLRKQLTDARMQTEWQLRRVYRARNLLVHAGASVPLIQYLYELLEYYYSLTLSRVIHDLQRNVGWGIEHSFEYRRLLNDYIYDEASRSPCPVAVEDFLQGASPLSSSKLLI